MSRKRPGRTKRKWIRERLQHVRERARERYGLEITDADIKILQERVAAFINARTPTPGVQEVSVATLERPYTIYAVEHTGVWVPVIYEHGRRIVHTMLPPEHLPEHFR